MNEAKDAVPSKALANDGLLQRAACSVQSSIAASEPMMADA